MADNFTLADYGVPTVAVTEIQDALATYVRKQFDKARQNKQQNGIDDRLIRNLRANKCEYQPDELALLGPYNDVYMGISALKARAAESWLLDIILNNIEKPWTLDPTPQPELPEKLKTKVVDMLLAELKDIQSIEALKGRAAQLKSAANSFAYAEAEKATAKMESLIADQMAEGNWTDTFTKFICDLTVYPTAMIRGPVLINKAQAEWKHDKLDIKVKALPTVRLVSAFDAYPAPNSTSTQDGDFFSERARYSPGDLHGLIGVEGFSDENLRQVLVDYADGYKIGLINDSTRDALEDKQQGVNNLSCLIDTIIYNGKIPGHLLKENGILVEDYQKHYECEVWVIGNFTVRAILTPNPTGERPIYSTSYRKLNGSFWGQSVIDLTYDVNRVCNASARALVRNMSYSSGPIGEVVSERVTETEDPTDIRPYKVALVGPDLSGTGAPAYRFHNVDSISNQLIEVFNQYLKYADDLSGVPSYVLGNPQVAGAGRTLGGLSMLMGNAAKGIKNVQLNIDRDIIVGVVYGLFIYNMLTSKDDSIKADCKVVARGATGLLQRELAQTRTIEILHLLTPFIQPGPNGEPAAIAPQGISILLREILKTTGLPIDDIIPDPKKEEQLRDLAQSLGQEATSNRGTSSPVPLPIQSQPQGGSPLSPRPMAVNMPQGA